MYFTIFFVISYNLHLCKDFLFINSILFFSFIFSSFLLPSLKIVFLI